MPKSIHRTEYRRTIEELRARRELLGMTQAKLASRLRRTQQWVSLLESGGRRLDIVEYVELCQALDLDPLASLRELMARLRRLPESRSRTEKGARRARKG